MNHKSLNLSIKPSLFLIFMMVFFSGQVFSGNMTITNGDQNNGYHFYYSGYPGEYNCIDSSKFIGKNFYIPAGGSSKRVFTNTCGDEPAQFSLYTHDKLKIAFMMHGDGGFQLRNIPETSGGYKCTRTPSCLIYSSADRHYTFTTNHVDYVAPAKAPLKLGKMKGKWKKLCGSGITSCKLEITTAITNGKNETNIRSQETSNAITQSLTLGIEADVKVAGSGTKVSFESSTSYEYSQALATAREVGTSSEKSQEVKRIVEVDYDKFDVKSVWRWVLAAPNQDDSSNKVVISTVDWTCSPTQYSPEFLPNSPKHVKNPCLKKRKQ